MSKQTGVLPKIVHSPSLRIVSSEWRPLLLVVTLNVFGGLSQSVEPWIVARVIDVGILSRSWPQVRYLLFEAILLWVLRLFLIPSAAWSSFTLSQRVTLKLRESILHVLTNVSPSWHLNRMQGELNAIVEEDVSAIALFCADVAGILIRLLVAAIGAVVFMATMSGMLGAAMASAALAFLLLTFLFQSKLTVAASQLRNAAGQVAGFVTDRLAGIPEMQFLSRTKHLRDSTKTQWLYLLAHERQHRRLEVIFSVVISSFIFSVTGACLYRGSWDVLHGSLKIGALVALYAYLQRFFDPLMSTWETSRRAAMVRVSVRRVDEVMSSPLQQDVIPNVPQEKAPADTGLSVDCVSITVQGKMILSNVSCSIHPGDIVALVGASGAGKTTLARAIVKAMAIQSGIIRYRGYSVDEHPVNALRSEICYIPQTITIFRGSIADNLLVGVQSINKGELDNALAMSGLDKIINCKDRGLDYQVGVRGSMLSGGERQRIAIARAVLSSPRVLILDETTSALDEVSESALLERLKTLQCLQILILIAHRSSVLRHCTKCITVANNSLFTRNLDLAAVPSRRYEIARP